MLSYLRAIEQRVEKLPANPHRDRERMIEELRVSYFAQSLGTPFPVSDKRIYRVMDEL
ncbi:MAG TPA: DUF3418 domain-containing protein [Streptosporangiaceae bacterium]